MVHLDEQETTINLFPAQVDKMACISTNVPYMVKRFMKMASDYPDQVAIDEVSDTDLSVQIPASWIRIRPKRTMPDSYKQELLNRLSGRKEKKGL